MDVDIGKSLVGIRGASCIYGIHRGYGWLKIAITCSYYNA